MVAFNTEVKKVWNKRWEVSVKKEQLTFLGKLMFKAKINALQRVLRQIQVSNMIEVGCGLGHTLSVFQESGINSVGIDISEYAIEVCKNKGLNAKVQALQDVREKYDLVSSDGLLEHFLNFELYVSHMTKLSKKYILLIQPNHESFLGKTIVYFATLIRGKKNVYEYNYLINDFINIFDKYEFKPIKNESVFFDIFRLLLFQKIH